MTAIPQALEAAIARHRQGHVDVAEPVYRAFCESHPQLAEPWHLLGVVHMQRGQAKDAEPFFREALKRDPHHVKCLSNLGGALYLLHRHAEAQEHLRAALKIDPGYESARYNLGNSLLAVGRCDEAVDSFKQSIHLRPTFYESHNNLAEALKRQGKFAEAFEVLQAALASDPHNALLTTALVELLNHYAPPADSPEPHAKAQRELARLRIPSTDAAALGHLYGQCRAILDTHGLSDTAPYPQLWRGEAFDAGCRRHMAVFNTYKAIPEHCFGCYKILIEPRTVVELFQVMALFERLTLPHDNARKCLVEVRPEIGGTYKALLYAHDLADAQTIEAVVKRAVDEQIAPQVAVTLKRGCSEFPEAYPEYAHDMTYDEGWRKFEDAIDEELAEERAPPPVASHNHQGLTLRDALVLQTWIAYAAMIGDASTHTLTSAPVPGVVLPIR